MAKGKDSRSSNFEVIPHSKLSNLNSSEFSKYSGLFLDALYKAVLNVIKINKFYTTKVQKYMVQKKKESEESEEKSGRKGKLYIAIKQGSKVNLDTAYLKRLDNSISTYFSYVKKLSAYKSPRIERIETLTGANSLYTVGPVLSSMFGNLESVASKNIRKEYVEEMDRFKVRVGRKLVWPNLKALNERIQHFKEKLETSGETYSNKDLDARNLEMFESLASYIRRGELEEKPIVIDTTHAMSKRAIVALYHFFMKTQPKNEDKMYEFTDVKTPIGKAFAIRPSSKKQTGRGLTPHDSKTMASYFREVKGKVDGEDVTDFNSVTSSAIIIFANMTPVEKADQPNIRKYLNIKKGSRTTINVRKVVELKEKTAEWRFFNNYYISALLKFLATSEKIIN